MATIIGPVRNLRVGGNAGNPSNNLTGRLYHDTNDGNRLKYDDGASFYDFLNAIASAHTAITVTDTNGSISLDLVPSNIALDDVGNPDSEVSMAGQKITNIQDAVNDADVPSYLQVRNLALDTFPSPTSSLDMGGQIVGNVGAPNSDDDAANITAVKALGLDVITGTLTQNINLGGTYTITGLGAPSNPSDAVRKTDLDAVQYGLDWKQSVVAASTANVDISSAPATIDGVTLASGDRVLLKNQTTGSQNGVYDFASSGSAMTRSTDADADAEVTAGLTVFVSKGTANSGTTYRLTTEDNITVGTTALTFTQVNSTGQVEAGAGLTKNGNIIDVVAGGTGLTVNANDIQLAAALQSIAGLTTSADKMIYTTGSNVYTTATLTSFARTLLDDADASTARATLGVEPGTNVQAYSGLLDDLAGLTQTADTVPYFDSNSTASTFAVTSTARGLLDDSTVSDMRSTLGTPTTGSYTIDGDGSTTVFEWTHGMSTDDFVISVRCTAADSVHGVSAGDYVDIADVDVSQAATKLRFTITPAPHADAEYKVIAIVPGA